MITHKITDKLVGLSTDTKPINVANGTQLFCMDSKKTYIFDKAGATWYEYVDPDAPSGGGGLPEVSAEDNGDVLAVVDGAWAKAASGGSVLVCNLDTQTMTFDKTWQEIHDAGFAVVVGLSSGVKKTMPVLATGEDDGDYLVICESFLIENGVRVPYYLTFTADASDGYPYT